jgi:N-acetylglutamate synthase-like GNAT family acetyltransferase
MPKRVSKAFVLIGDHYLFSEKRAPQSPEKDHRLELIGGAMESGETPFQGLLRELQEEEPSGTLSKKANTLNSTPREIVVGIEPHFIYQMTITDDEYKRITHDAHESYGFHLVQKSVIMDIDKLKANISLFTPKTIAIFRELGLLSSDAGRGLMQMQSGGIRLSVTIERADTRDAEEILALQKLAFQSEAKLYNDYTLPPLTQTLEEMQADIENKIVLKASVDGRIVGSVRAHMKSQRICYVGRLVVHPDCQTQGLGTRLMNEIEVIFSRAERFKLFTGHRSENTLHLYHKLGYQEFKRERVSDDLTLVFLEKRPSAEQG